MEETEEVSEEDVEEVVSEEIEEDSEEEEDPISVTKIKQEKKEPFQDSKELEDNFDFSFQNHFILIFYFTIIIFFILFVCKSILLYYLI